MPHIMIKIRTGYTEQEKSSLAEAIVATTEDQLKCNRDAISVAIAEIVPEAWAEDVYRPEIYPVMDKLHKKPGYSL